jgi:dienelactone hydrolase
MICTVIRRWVAIATILLVLLPTLAFAFGSKVYESWDKAVVYLPNSDTPTTIDSVKLERAAPVILYFHGCDGIPGGAGENHKWAKELAKLGMVVVMPDSLARTDRTMGDSRTGMCKQSPAVYDMRLEEIDFATKAVKTQPWFDGRNLFLMGWSEGASSVIRTKNKDYSGVVGVSWTCTHRSESSWDGVFLPPITPVLTLLHEEDPSLSHEVIRGSCATKFSGRTDAANVTLPGKGHRTYYSELARQSVTEFLRRLVKLDVPKNQ